MKPITRKEKFLAKAGGQEVSLPEPITREEMFLAAAAGVGTAPAPITRKEMFMAAISGGGGSTMSATGTVTPTDTITRIDIQHNLGVVPNFAAIFCERVVGGSISGAGAIEYEIVEIISFDNTTHKTWGGYSSNRFGHHTLIKPITEEWSMQHNAVHSATDTYISFGSLKYDNALNQDGGFFAGYTYRWIVGVIDK